MERPVRAVGEARMNDPIGAVGNVISSIAQFFQNLAPHGFGFLVIPIGILGVIALLAARKNLPIE
jgi:hypothetical protein